MEFEQAMRTLKRMCESNDQCKHCPIPAHDATRCHAWVMRNAGHASEILAKWAAEHPERTIADDFFEKHPKAMKHPKGTPQACAQTISYVKSCTVGCNCFKCWQRPLEEVER